MLPGRLEPVYSFTKWLDLVYKSDLDDRTKLVATVMARCSAYSRKDKVTYSTVSNYSVSRILKVNSSEAALEIAELVRLGWIWPEGVKSYILTFSKIPVEMRK
jgi:hypothetical protein